MSGQPRSSPLKSWINGFDSEKAASGRCTPSIGSAYARLTAVPASPSIPPAHNLPSASVIAGISSSPLPLATSCSPSSNPQSSESPSNNQPRYRPPHLRSGPTLPTPSSKPAPEGLLKPAMCQLPSSSSRPPAHSTASSKALFAPTTPGHKHPSSSFAKSPHFHIAPGLDTSMTIADSGPKAAD